MTTIRFWFCAGFISVVGAAAASADGGKAENNIFTLYRSSILGSDWRIHIATFDVTDGTPSYNAENCQIAAELFQNQPGVSVRYWCEPGRYRKHWN
jgi:hypothetical protein